MSIRSTTRLPRLIAILVLVLVSGCGFDAQTLQPYTPALGVNADVGPAGAVKVRNLLIVSRTPGQGFLSASILATSEPDALVEVSGTAFERDQTTGIPLESDLTSPLPLPTGELVVLTERPVIRVSSSDLHGGGAARVTLRFQRAGELTMLVPIYEDVESLESISPVPRTGTG